MTPFTIVQCSNFNGLNRYRSEGAAAMQPVLEQRAALGFNALRDWTVFNISGIGVSAPTDDLYAAIPDYLALCEAYGLYVEITAFTGPYPYFPSQDAMLTHWDRLINVLHDCPNLLDLEAVNEGDNGPNQGVPLNQLTRPPFLSSHGSATQDAPPMSPPWSVAGFRPASNEWQRKVGHNAMEWADTWHLPVWSNETTRMPDNDGNPNHAYDAAASAALLCAGSCFHSPAGKAATLFSGQELVCAQAWANGARSVPLEFQQGVYFHPDDAGYLRRYGRRLPDGREYIVGVRP